ncbi:ZSCA2 protein, partial [Todus mexicanus]|nr:ZSCA2 protein [Todus mexicanus]
HGHGRCHDCGKALPFGSPPAERRGGAAAPFGKRRRGAADRPHKCPECGKGFRLSSTLLSHQRCHAADKPFKCPDCGKTFSVGSAFIQHQRVHG